MNLTAEMFAMLFFFACLVWFIFVVYKIYGGKIMGKRKDTDETEERKQKLEEARKLLEEEEERQRDGHEETPIIDTSEKEPFKQEVGAGHSEEYAKLQKLASYLDKEGYFDAFTQQAFNSPEVMQCNLLFGILAELKAIKEALQK